MKPCPHCNAENAYDARFCVACGRSFPSLEISEPDLCGETESPLSENAEEEKCQSVHIEICVPMNAACVKKDRRKVAIALVTCLILGILLSIVSFAFFLASLSGNRGTKPWVNLCLIVGLDITFFSAIFIKTSLQAFRDNPFITEQTFRVVTFDDTYAHNCVYMGEEKCSEINIRYEFLSYVSQNRTAFHLSSALDDIIVPKTLLTRPDEEKLNALLRAKCRPSVLHL